MGEGEGQGHRVAPDVVIQYQSSTWASRHHSWHPLLLPHDFCLLCVSQHKEENSQEVWDQGNGEGEFSKDRELPRGHLIFPWLSPQGSGHNVSQEAIAIKRMLEMGAVKNLTYF